MKIVKFVFLGGKNAGKSSILQRYFHGNFEAQPTIGADIYSRIIWFLQSRSSSVSSQTESSINNMIGREKRQVSIQAWDTPGRNGTASFSDQFLVKLDVAVLIYDVSSSTSFTHVLNWYYELIERIKRMKANEDRQRKLPIVIVGNKIDIFEERKKQKKLRKKEVVRQRDVLKLGGNWTGKDYRYEYSASPPSLHPSSSIVDSSSSSSTSSRPQQLELLTYYDLGTNRNYLEAILNSEVYRGSYLDSLVSAEDKSHPDKDMVQLWCMRNGLIHMDVSAKSGVGIDKLIHQLVDIALKETDENNTYAKLKFTGNDHATSNDDDPNAILQRVSKNMIQWNDELDLRKRYNPPPAQCFPFHYC